MDVKTRSVKAVFITIRIGSFFLFALALLAAAAPETGVRILLPVALVDQASGRLLVFAATATAENADASEVDTDGSGKNDVWIAARNVSSFGPERAVTIDTDETAFPSGFETIAPGDYRVQIVLDRDRNYNRSGRGPGDIVSKVVTLHFPLTSIPVISLDHINTPETAQFDTEGLPKPAADQIAASRSHLYDEHIASRVLTRFRGTQQSIAAWVLTPPGYHPGGFTTYPTVYTAGGFNTNHKLDGQQLSRIWHLMETGAIPPMIWVSLDFSTVTGTTEFADSLNNGPWGQAFTSEVIPALEAKYRMDAKPSGRFLTGHSSGGWFALWAIVRYPALFGGSWPTSPDSVDFRDFLGVDIYAPGANVYRNVDGKPRPLERDHDKILATIERSGDLESVLGDNGGQLRSLDWTFSPRRIYGPPASLFDHESGAVDPAVASYWRDNYDIGYRIETQWPRLKPNLDGKVHLTVGAEDSFYLDGAVHKLEAAFHSVGGHAEFTYVPGANHAVAQVYARDGNCNALWIEIANAMYAVARPSKAEPRR